MSGRGTIIEMLAQRLLGGATRRAERAPVLREALLERTTRQPQADALPDFGASPSPSSIQEPHAPMLTPPPDAGRGGGEQFTQPIYRGQAEGFTEGRPGAHEWWSDEGTASTYGTVTRGDFDPASALTIDVKGANAASIPRSRLPRNVNDEITRIIQDEDVPPGSVTAWAREVPSDIVARAAQNVGSPNVIFRNMRDDIQGAGRPTTVYAIGDRSSRRLAPPAPDGGAGRGVQIRVSPTRPNLIEALDENGRQIGTLEVAQEAGRAPFARGVLVDVAHQRTGVATKMYQEAERRFGRMEPSTEQSDEARAFWESYRPSSRAPARGDALSADAGDYRAYLEGLRSQGFDVERPLYHGTVGDFLELDPQYAKYRSDNALYFSRNPSAAGLYASGEGGNIRPVFVRGRLMPWDQYQAIVDRLRAEGKAHGWAGRDLPTNAAREEARRLGFDGVDSPTETIVFDAANVAPRFGPPRQPPNAGGSSALQRALRERMQRE